MKRIEAKNDSKVGVKDRLKNFRVHVLMDSTFYKHYEIKSSSDTKFAEIMIWPGHLAWTSSDNRRFLFVDHSSPCGVFLDVLTIRQDRLDTVKGLSEGENEVLYINLKALAGGVSVDDDCIYSLEWFFEKTVNVGDRQDVVLGDLSHIPEHERAAYAERLAKLPKRFREPSDDELIELVGKLTDPALPKLTDYVLTKSAWRV